MSDRRPAGRSQGYVDYERHASRYREGRALPAEVLGRWGDRVRSYLPAGRCRVVDAGAGTGIFAVAWPRWTDARVVALEPSPAMLAEADRRPGGAAFLRGVAEAVPVRDGWADVVWVSTALHHFADADKAASEFRRVLTDGGRVMVRGPVPGRTSFDFLEQVPGRRKWERRLLDEQQMVALFAGHGFDLVDLVEVLERTERFAESADWMSSMRHVDSLLTALDDDEIAAGLGRLRATPDRIGRLELTLAVFERR